ncbi:MAG: hypothetical protein HUJ68_01115 [Clostridia bacterium]|nr:hypothetical protein [Clostridia bacterium]
MNYSIEPAYTVYNELSRQIIKAGTNPINKWFFSDGAFSADIQLEKCANTWTHENFVVIENKEILAYFEAPWNKPLNIISSFRLICFNKKKVKIIGDALFDYFEYLFLARGCNAFNWIVAEKNYHAVRIYRKFIKHYFGHYVGTRHCGQKAYNGEVSDVFLYEITKEEYFNWREAKGRER